MQRREHHFLHVLEVIINTIGIDLNSTISINYIFKNIKYKKHPVTV